MSREIKFRAWDKETEQYFKVLAIDFESKIVSCRCFKWKYGPSNPINLDDLALEQFTGLKDRNGKDIYEGDLLKFKILFSDDDYEVGQVAWSNQDAGFILECFNLWKFASRAEIIGNIHKNIEFLEEK